MAEYITNTMDTITDKINISTLVYMLETNIKIDPNKLNELYEKIEPIPYEVPIDGIIKISVRGNTKGLCKKLVFRRSHGNTSQVKNFRNQISFYIRIIDNMKANVVKIQPNFNDGIFPKEITDMQEYPSNIYQYKKGQTAFQFKNIYASFSANAGEKIIVFTSVTRKNQAKQIKYIEHIISEDEAQQGKLKFEFTEGCYAHSLFIMANNEINLKMNLDFVVEVNMFMFTSGKIKIAGCTREYQIDKAMNVLMQNLNLNEDKMLELFGVKKDDFVISNKNPVMINSDFAGNYEIKRYELDILVRQKYKVMSSFEPCTHPAVIIKYYHNLSFETNNGKCLCDSYFGNATLCTGRGCGSGAGECKTVTILVFQSGKVILTGARKLIQVKEGYQFINSILNEHKHILDRHYISNT